MGFMKIEDKWMVFAVTAMINFICTFTITSINLALPSMSVEFGVSMGIISWVSLIYMLTLSSSLMMFGRMGDLYGYRVLFILGFSIFAIISIILPTMSVNIPLLIFFRCLQAIGGSMLVSVTYALISKSFGPEERGKALGINAVFVSIGLAAGPSFGGWLVTYFGWPSLFYVNIPFCILGILTSLKYVNKSEISEKHKKMDWLGAIVFGIIIFALSIAINFVDEWGIISKKFIACFLIFIVGFLLFIYLEKRQKEPLMELSLFINKRFSFSIIASLLSYIAQMMTTFLMPFYLVNILLFNQDKAGLVMLATPLIMMFAAPCGGRMADRIGTKRPALLGLTAVGLGCCLMSQLNSNSNIVYILFNLSLFGLGNGISVSAINTAIISSVPSEHTGVASGMAATVRNIGQSLGVAFGGMFIALRTIAYTNAGQLEGDAIYILAQRDAFIFGTFVVLIAFFSISRIPSIIKS